MTRNARASRKGAQPEPELEARPVGDARLAAMKTLTFTGEAGFTHDDYDLLMAAVDELAVLRVRVQELESELGSARRILADNVGEKTVVYVESLERRVQELEAERDRLRHTLVDEKASRNLQYRAAKTNRQRASALEAGLVAAQEALRDLVSETEFEAARRSTAAGLGASEWEAFVPEAMWQILTRARAVLDGATPPSPTCPRGCVDTDGCGCEWNAPAEVAVRASQTNPKERQILELPAEDAHHDAAAKYDNFGHTGTTTSDTPRADAPGEGRYRFLDMYAPTDAARPVGGEDATRKETP